MRRSWRRRGRWCRDPLYTRQLEEILFCDPMNWRYLFWVAVTVVLVFAALARLKTSSGTEAGTILSHQVAPEHMSVGMNSDSEPVHYRRASYRPSYDKWWTAEEGVHFGANSSNIFIETAGKPPGEEHFKLLDRIFADESAIHAELEKLLFEYYLRVRHGEAKRMTKELDQGTADVLLPEISKQSGIWRVAGYSALELPVQTDAHLRFRIRFLCNWDDENGLQAHYVDGKLQGLEKGKH